MTEDDMSGGFKGPRKLYFSWPSKQRHLENTLKVKGNEKLDLELELEQISDLDLWTFF